MAVILKISDIFDGIVLTIPENKEISEIIHETVLDHVNRNEHILVEVPEILMSIQFIRDAFCRLYDHHDRETLREYVKVVGCMHNIQTISSVLKHHRKYSKCQKSF